MPGRRRREPAGDGFHVIDVYSLWDSLNGVMDYVPEHQPEALEAALHARQTPRCWWARAVLPHDGARRPSEWPCRPRTAGTHEALAAMSLATTRRDAELDTLPWSA